LDEEHKIQTVQGFGRWKYLKQAIRQQGEGNRILDLSKKFQKAFFEGKYELDDYENFTDFQSQSDNLFTYIEYPDYSEENVKQIAEKIFQTMKQYHIHPNDTIILSSRIKPLKELDFIMRNEFAVKTITTFESREMQEFQNTQKFNAVKDVRKIKKIHFRQNSGKYKLSTVHSYKGFESKAVMLLINKDDFHNDDPEMVYAGFTRSKSDLLIIAPSGSNFSSFFSTEMQVNNSPNKDNELLKTLKQYIYDKVCIDLEYEQHHKNVKYENVKPYKILFMQDNFYVACEVDNKYKFMMFRISKVKTITETNIQFYHNPDIKEFIDNIQTPFSRYSVDFKNNMIDVVIKVDKPKANFFKMKKFL
ncbi:MAG: WYL domain-containing protein, partial [Caldisericia bacterium]|nr:WYL domain-containing protein [Caldisericia bacterium]